MTSTVIYTIDIGDENLRAGIYEDGETRLVTVMRTPKEPFSGGSHKLLDRIRSVINILQNESPPMQALAVSASGVMTLRPKPDARTYGPFKDSELYVVAPNVDGLKYQPLLKMIEDLGYGVPVHIENDVNAALESEEAHDTVICIALGAGLGAAAKRNGRVIHAGNSWSCFEIGHGMRWQLPEETSLLCHCANTGCLEAAIGGWAMVQRYGIAPEDADAETYDQMRQDVIQLLPQAIASIIRQTGIYDVAMTGRGAEGYSQNSTFLDDLRDHVNAELGTDNVTVTLLSLGDTAELHGTARALLHHNVI